MSDALRSERTKTNRTRMSLGDHYLPLALQAQLSIIPKTLNLSKTDF